MKILIATPSRGTVGMLHVASLVDIVRALVERKISFDYAIEGASPCWVARDKVASYFLDKECDATHLFFFDDDTSIRAADFMRLVDAKKDVIGITYRKRLRDMTEHEYTCRISNWQQDIADDGTIEVDRIGTGALLISRKALAAVAAYHSELSHISADNNQFLGVFRETVDPGFVSEDYSFCDRWKKLGGKIYCLVNAETEHQGPHSWLGNFANNWPHMKKAALAQLEDEK